MPESPPDWSAMNDDDLPCASLAEESSVEGVLTLLTSVRAGKAVCILTGELDCASAPWLLEELELLPACGVTHLVVDVRRLSFFGAVGVDVLVAALARLGPAAAVTVRSPSPTVTRILEICGLCDWIEPSHHVRRSAHSGAVALVTQ
jgi:anti-anti-sigma factor